MDERDEARAPGAGPAGEATLDGVWEHFYDHCFRIIHQCPGVRRLPDADREDCVQEVMVELVRRFGEARPEAGRDDLTGLIRALSRNKAADIVRRRVRKPEVPFDDGSGAALPDDDLGPPAAGAGPDQGEYVSLVWEALLSLDQEVTVTSYLIFYLRTIESWAVPEIAELFQISPEQARARCHRVRKKFATILQARGERRGRSGPA